MKPSEVFAFRLRQTRKGRDGLTQTQLSARMTEVGRPISTTQLAAIEKRTRGLLLDEAIALAAILHASPANLLSPPEGTMVALTDKLATDSEGLRDWLQSGLPFLAWPDARPEDGLRVEGLAPDQKRSSVDVLLERALRHHATVLVDAGRAADGVGVKTALKAIVDTVNRHREAVESIEEERQEEGAG